MDGITVLIMLSIAILVLLIFIILKSSKVEQTKKTDESLTLLDRSFERQETKLNDLADQLIDCLLYTSPSPRDSIPSRMPSSA